MRLVHAHRQLTSWITALAILLAALVPTLSHALASTQGSGGFEICTAQGSKWIAQRPDSSPSAPAASHVFEHCPFCAMQVPALGLPPCNELVPMLIEGHGEFPAAFYAAPRTPHVWLSAGARAPPQRA